ncbi:MAG: vWA domain-containing protein [Polyangiaceae bacterium]
MMKLSRHLGWVIGLATASSGAVSACSSDSGDNQVGIGKGGNGGIAIGSSGGTGTPSTTDNATNPPPIPSTNTNGWVDITPQQRTGYVGSGCDGWSAEPEGLPSVLEFVLDVSGTMRATTATTGGQSKWAACAGALRTAVGALPGNLSVGYEFFPNKNNGGAIPNPTDHTPCIDHSNDVAPALLGAANSAQRNALNASLNVTPDANAATPTHDALDYAFQVLRQNPSSAAKYAVLITDGQPTLAQGCYGMANPRMPDDTNPIIAAIQAANQQYGIRTFVVGSPGSEKNEGTGTDVRGWLSAAARAGGTATAGCKDTGGPFCHFDLTMASDFGTALTQALRSIGKAVVGCDYVLPLTSPSGDKIDPNKVNLIYTDGSGQSHLLLPNGDPNCSVGWHYLDPPAYTQIHICGKTCDTLENDPAASLDLVFGCVSGTVPPVL